MVYVSGFLTPVEDARRDEYIRSAAEAWPLFKEYGAREQMEAWRDNVPEGKLTDFRRAVDLKDGEAVCFSWVLWPDRATADACEASMETDKRWKKIKMPFDGKRMIFGGFLGVLNEKA